MGLKARIEQHVKGIACSLCLFFYLLMLILSFSRATVWHFESHVLSVEALRERLLWPGLTALWSLIVPGIGIFFLVLLVMMIVFAFQKKKIAFLFFLTLFGTFFCLLTWGIWTMVP